MEQDRTPAEVSHVEANRQQVVFEVLVHSCFPTNSKRFPSSGQVHDFGVEVVTRGRGRVFSGWCLAVSRINTYCINHVTIENGLGLDFTQAVKPISYGRDILSINFHIRSRYEETAKLLGNAPCCFG